MGKPIIIKAILWCISALLLIIIMIAIYSNLQLYKSRGEAFLKKRSLSGIFGLNISIILTILISLINMIYSEYFDYHSITMDSIFTMLYFALWFLIFVFLNVKSFLIHFRYKWQYYALQSQWQQIINPNIVNELNKN
eukprot:14305_1